MHILILEDDLQLGQALQKALKVEGMSSEWVRRIADIPVLGIGERYDCALFDIALPDGNGLSMLRKLRHAGVTLPIIVITASSGLNDCLAGLDGGADDFVVKPFAMAEIVSRLRAVVRRFARQASELWTVGELDIEPRSHTVRLSGQPLTLSPREFRLLLELAREPGTVIPKGLLAQKIEPLGEAIEFATLEVHVSHLRRKIGADRIRTVRGVGYMLSAR